MINKYEAPVNNQSHSQSPRTISDQEGDDDVVQEELLAREALSLVNKHHPMVQIFA